MRDAPGSNMAMLLRRALSIASLLVATMSWSQQASAVSYLYTPLPYGDETTATDLSDSGAVLYCCFDGLGFSQIQTDPGVFNPTQNFADFPNSSHYGVFVDEINAAGDGRGIVLVDWFGFPVTEVPTIWTGGVPYDMTDPANAGIHFTPDPGPLRELLESTSSR